jgi:hypothetical protein
LSDFVTLAQTVGVPLAMTITAVAILARALVVVSRDKDKISDSRFNEMKEQYEARLREVTEDRDFNRDRLYQLIGLAESQNMTFEELVKRVARQIPPPRAR